MKYQTIFKGNEAYPDGYTLAELPAELSTSVIETRSLNAQNLEELADVFQFPEQIHLKARWKPVFKTIHSLGRAHVNGKACYPCDLYTGEVCVGIDILYEREGKAIFKNQRDVFFRGNQIEDSYLAWGENASQNPLLFHKIYPVFEKDRFEVYQQELNNGQWLVSIGGESGHLNQIRLVPLGGVSSKGCTLRMMSPFWGWVETQQGNTMLKVYETHQLIKQGVTPPYSQKLKGTFWTFGSEARSASQNLTSLAQDIEKGRIIAKLSPQQDEQGLLYEAYGYGEEDPTAQTFSIYLKRRH